MCTLGAKFSNRHRFGVGPRFIECYQMEKSRDKRSAMRGTCGESQAPRQRALPERWWAPRWIGMRPFMQAWHATRFRRRPFSPTCIVTTRRSRHPIGWALASSSPSFLLLLAAWESRLSHAISRHHMLIWSSPRKRVSRYTSTGGNVITTTEKLVLNAVRHPEAALTQTYCQLSGPVRVRATGEVWGIWNSRTICPQRGLAPDAQRNGDGIVSLSGISCRSPQNP